MKFRVGDKVRVDLSATDFRLGESIVTYWHNRIVTVVSVNGDIIGVDYPSYYGGKASFYSQNICLAKEHQLLFPFMMR